MATKLAARSRRTFHPEEWKNLQKKFTAIRPQRLAAPSSREFWLGHLVLSRAVTELREAAQEAGFAWHVVCRAKAIAGVDGRREGWGPNGRYFWFLERDGQERPEDESFWEDLADGSDRSERADWDYHEQSADGAEGAYREEMARLSKLTNPMAVEPDFSAPSDQGLTSCEGSCGTTDHPAKPVEDDSCAAVGAVAQRQKAAEISMENKKTGQADEQKFCPIMHDVDGGLAEHVP